MVDPSLSSHPISVGSYCPISLDGSHPLSLGSTAGASTRNRGTGSGTGSHWTAVGQGASPGSDAGCDASGMSHGSSDGSVRAKEDAGWRCFFAESSAGLSGISMSAPGRDSEGPWLGNSNGDYMAALSDVRMRRNLQMVACPQSCVPWNLNDGGSVSGTEEGLSEENSSEEGSFGTDTASALREAREKVCCWR